MEKLIEKEKLKTQTAKKEEKKKEKKLTSMELQVYLTALEAAF